MPPVPAAAARRDAPRDGAAGIGMVEWSIPAMGVAGAAGDAAAEGVPMSIFEWSIPAIAESSAGAPRAAPVSVSRAAVAGADRGSSFLPVHDVSSSAVASSDFRQKLVEGLLRCIG